MRDFPIFTTEFGAGSLILREIPYRKEAYIHIGSFQKGNFSAHLHECVSFCRMAGAERIFAAGAGLEEFPVHMAVLRMQGSVCPGEEIASLFPVTEQTASRWRQYYNEGMRAVDNARTLETRDEQKLLASGAYFVHEQRELLGIGWLEGNQLLAVCACRPGAGERVVRTLMSAVEEEQMVLEVASTNHRALRLYERLGFLITGQTAVWHDVSAYRIDESRPL